MKQIIIFTFFGIFIIPLHLKPQVAAIYPDIEWEKTYGGTLQDFGRGIKQLQNGTLLIYGTTRSDDGDITFLHDLAGDIWLAQIDTDGTLLWQRSYGGSDWDLIPSIHETPDGGYAMTGTVWWGGGDVAGYHYGADDLPDGWFVKMDSAFNIQWNEAYGSSDWESLSDFALAPDGYILVGETGGYYYDDDSEITIQKIDEVGNEVWMNYIGGSEYEDASQILQTTDGGYMIVGQTSSNNYDVSGNHGETDGWVVKIDGEGEIVWQKCLGGSDDDNIQDMQSTSDNGFIFLGSSLSSDGDLTENKGNPDIWVIKTDSMANIEWQRSMGGSYWDLPGAVKILDNGYLITGYTGSTDGDVTDNIYLGGAMWLIKLGIDGSIEWTHSYGGNGYDSGSDIILTDDGYYSIGTTTSNDGDITFNHGLYDFWVVKLYQECEHIHYFADYDEDGFGNILSDTLSCTSIPGFITDGTDCADSNSLIHPFTEDICNSVDDNCNGEIDEDAVFTNYFMDADIDGFGDAFIDSTSCSILPGYVSDSTDCNDSNAGIYPGATELCNFIDDNCNLLVDDGIAYVHGFEDADGDGFGNSLNDTIACDLALGFVVDSTDCDDSNAGIYPGSTELCNFIDDNCNLLVDDGIDYVHGFEDADGDGFGNLLIDTFACDLPLGFVIDSTDCDDQNSNIYPGSTEIYNGIDDNCDGVIDEYLFINGQSVINIFIYPNPVIDVLSIDCTIHGYYTLKIRNVWSQNIEIDHYFNTSTFLNVKDLSPGMYLIEFFNSNQKIAGMYFIKL